MTSTIIQSGSFTSDGTAERLDIRSDVDWIEVWNFTQAGAQQTPGRGVKFYWQRGMDDGSAFMVTKLDAVDTTGLETVSTGGFILLNTSVQTPGPLNTTGTAITNASPAVVSASSTSGLVGGDVVRMINCVNMQQISGVEFTISNVVSNTSFTLPYLSAGGFASPGTTNSFRRIPFDPQFSPRLRTITGITLGTTTSIQMSVDHGYLVGEVVRFQVPSEFGTTEINGLTGEVLSVNLTINTITVDINSSSFSAFAFPASGDVPFDFANVIPVGTNSQQVIGQTDNVSLIGMELGAGADGPAGSTSDVIFWKAGKSSVVTN